MIGPLLDRSSFASVARLVRRLSKAGYHKKGNIVQAFFGINQEFAKVYSNGTFIGNIILETKSGRWIAKFEKLG